MAWREAGEKSSSLRVSGRNLPREPEVNYLVYLKSCLSVTRCYLSSSFASAGALAAIVESVDIFN